MSAHNHHFPSPTATIDVVIVWTDWRGRDFDADCTARYELRGGRPFITGWTLYSDRYVDDAIVEAQIYDELDETGYLAAEAYVPAMAGRA